VGSRWPLPSPWLAFGIALSIAACGGGGSSFDPSSPCTTDGRFGGAYPDLEALVPATLGGRPPNRLDSGRSCTAAGLSTLARHDVHELHFAGGLWEQGARSGTTLVVFDSATRLSPEWIAEFYEAGAKAGRNTENIKTAERMLDGTTAREISALNGDSFQTVLVWAQGTHVVAAIVASDARDVGSRQAHEASVSAAIQAFRDNV
jgi:hypothetical protein